MNEENPRIEENPGASDTPAPSHTASTESLPAQQIPESATVSGTGSDTGSENGARPDEERAVGGAPAVRILGRGDGVVIQLAQQDIVWAQMLEMLTAHFEQARGFFRGERVTLELGAHAVGARDLQQLLNVLSEQEVQLRMLRTGHPGVHQLAQDMGVPVTWQPLETEEAKPRESLIESVANWEVLLTGRRRNPVQTVADFQMPPSIVEAIADAVQGESRAAQPTDPTTASNDAIAPAVHSTVIESASAPDLVQRISAPPYLYRGTLRSGQIFRHAGSVIVIGDVNPGAQVVSGSDVYIWGRLRGVVHAGAMGDEKAVIGALDFEPVQVRIAGYIAMSPRGNASDPGRWFWKRQATDRPEIARVVKGQVVVDQWDARMLAPGR